MSYITIANASRIIYKSNIKDISLKGNIYRIPIYFFSKYEVNALLAIQELLKDPENYFTEIYQPYKAEDTHNYIYEGQQPAYHEYSCCPILNSDYRNYEIPAEIKVKGTKAIEEFRSWFEKVKHLIDSPEKFAFRLQTKWGIVTNPKAIIKGNSGSLIFENITIEELENRIDSLIKEAGKFYYDSKKNQEILKRFSKYASSIANSDTDIQNNNTDYSDQEVKELLKYYDSQFKKPLKKYLVEYYRLKLNPQIEMQGYLLNNLGFHYCGHCSHKEYIPKNESDRRKKAEKEMNDLPF